MDVWFGAAGGVVMRGRRRRRRGETADRGDDKTVSLQGSSRLGYWADDVVFSDVEGEVLPLGCSRGQMMGWLGVINGDENKSFGSRHCRGLLTSTVELTGDAGSVLSC